MKPVPAVILDPTFAFTFPQPDQLRPPLAQFNEVSFGYGDKPNLFSGLSFSIDHDSRIAIIGANGQGKTTILNLLTGDLKARTGFVQLNQRLRLAKFSQHHVDGMPLDRTPIEFLQKDFPGKDVQVYREYLGKYGITGDMVFQKIKTLSGGQKSRAVFAHIAMKNPHLLVFDEPTNHLDIETVDVLAQALNDYEGGVIIVSHNERLINLVCDELWLVEHGKVKKLKGDFDSYKKRLLQEFQF